MKSKILIAIFEQFTSILNFFHCSRSIFSLPSDEISEWFYEYVSQCASELDSPVSSLFRPFNLISGFFPVQN